MSYNVHDLLDDRAAAARVVRAVAPDVLCLQEVPRRLTTELRLPPFARDCRLVWRRGRLGTGGTAVLTAPRVVVHDVSTDLADVLDQEAAVAESRAEPAAPAS